MPSQITTLTIVYPTVYSGAHQRKHQKLRVTGLCAGIYWCPVNSPHKWPVTRKMFPLDDVIMCYKIHTTAWLNIKLYTSQLPKLPKLTQRTHDAIITLFLLGSVISYIKKYITYPHWPSPELSAAHVMGIRQMVLSSARSGSPISVAQ